MRSFNVKALKEIRVKNPFVNWEPEISRGDQEQMNRAGMCKLLSFSVS